jgi:hypothetical protein
MAERFGTIAWARRTQGHMSHGDRMRELARGLATRVAALPTAMRRRGVSAIDLETVRAPDTTIARAAEALCREVSPAWLFEHSLRGYLWARFLAARDELTYDDELLYVGCVLHDLGLTERYGHVTDGACFTLASARGACELAAAHGWDDARQYALADAIALHLNVSVAQSNGIEAHLLHEGVVLDVIGARARELPVATIESVLARHPRLGFKTELDARYRETAAGSPRCRSAFHLRWLMFARYLRRAPFAE